MLFLIFAAQLEYFKTKRFQTKYMVKGWMAGVLLSGILMIGCNESASNKNTKTCADTTTTATTADSLAITADTTNADTTSAETATFAPRPRIVRQTYKAGKLLRPNIKVKGIYITGPTAGTKRMKELVELITSTEMNAIVLDIKNDGGNVTYKIENQQAQEMNACIRYVRDMPGLIKDLHEQGIYVIGRIVCFKDGILAKNRPELALCKPDGTPVTDGKGQPWVNPYKKEVWEYICDLAEQATLDGFDEIQFDYVRFPIGDDANKADYGVDLKTYPREDGLNDFFDYANERLHKKEIIFGADLFGTVIGSDTDRDRTGQDYVDLAMKADALYPMIYPSHYGPYTFGFEVPDAHPYGTIKGAMELSQKQLARLGDSIPSAIIRPWLQCFSAPWVKGHINYGSVQLRQQIQAVYDAGYEEWILWNASNRYGYVKQALTTKGKVDTTETVTADTTAKTGIKAMGNTETKNEANASVPASTADTTNGN